MVIAKNCPVLRVARQMLSGQSRLGQTPVPQMLVPQTLVRRCVTLRAFHRLSDRRAVRNAQVGGQERR